MGIFKRKKKQPDEAEMGVGGTSTVHVKEPAPDAGTVMLTMDRSVSPGKSVHFTSAVEAEGWPLIQKLFGVEAVESVLLRDNFAIVARTEAGKWATLVPALTATIQDYFSTLSTEESEDELSLRQRVQAVLDQEVNPGVANHGGVITLARVEGTRVYLHMGGGCQGCGMASVTMREGIEHLIRAKVPEVTEILDHTDHSAGTNPYQ